MLLFYMRGSRLKLSNNFKSLNSFNKFVNKNRNQILIGLLIFIVIVIMIAILHNHFKSNNQRNDFTALGPQARGGCPINNSENINIPRSYTRINARAFQNCGNVRNVTIPYSVETVDQNAFSNLQKRIDNTKNVLKLLLENISNKDIIGYGASTKGNIVLNQCGINSKQIKYICDANKEKYGKYTPGSNIKIISKDKMRKLKPKYLLVLIWSFRKEVILQEKKYLESGGTLIFHLPSLHIINKYNYKSFINKNFDTFSFNF